MSAFVANGSRVRIPVSIFAFLTVFSTACKREVGSYNFDDASAEAQQAIASNVEFTLTEDIFQKWEKAQASLEHLPSGELDGVPDPGGNDPVLRGTRRLEASPRARQAIESAGLSVKNFVLATVALAQAVKASRGGVPPTVGAIASNVRFVMAHASRISGRGAANIWVPPSELSAEEMAAQEAIQMDSAASENSATGEQETQPKFLPQPSRDSTSGSSEPQKTDSLTIHLPWELT